MLTAWGVQKNSVPGPLPVEGDVRASLLAEPEGKLVAVMNANLPILRAHESEARCGERRGRVSAIRVGRQTLDIGAVAG